MTHAFSWQNSVSLCPASFYTPRQNFHDTPGISWLPTFTFQSPMLKKTSSFGGGIHSRRSYRSSQNCSISASLTLVVGTQTCDIKCFALEMNRDHSVVLEIVPKYCISDSFIDYECYTIFSKGFLPTVVDTMVI